MTLLTISILARFCHGRDKTMTTSMQREQPEQVTRRHVLDQNIRITKVL